jgi:RIO kinase 1
MAQPLALLIDDGIIDEVYTRLKSGKEADIYLVRHAGEVVAAKVYKERNARNFKNNSAYKEGRRVRNTRTQRAMDKGSRFGQASAEAAWKAKESEALHKLHAAGVRVPKPVMFYEGVLLMETILDANGRPAPRLIEAEIPREKAAEWYADVRAQAVKMLACDLVHGDLSPYNVLLAWNGPTVIDFPQVVGAAHNSQAERFFLRDLDTIHRFFASHDPALAVHAGDSREIWRAFERRELTPDFIPTGKGAHGPSKERQQERRDEHRKERPHERREPHVVQRQEPAKQRPHPERPAEQRQADPRHGVHAARPEAQEGQGHPQRSGQRPPQQPQRGGQQPPQQQAPQQQAPQRGGQPPQRGGQPRPPQQSQRGQQQPQRPGQQPSRPGQQPSRPGQQPRRPGQQPRKGASDPQVTLIQRIFGSSIGKPKHGGGNGGGRGHTHRKPHR